MLAVVLASLVGCTTSRRATTVAIAPPANHGRPFRLDLVTVSDARLARVLDSLDATEYFAAHEQIRREYPTGLRQESFDIVPGQVIRISMRCLGRRTVACFVFADYRTPGTHRLRLDRSSRGTLILLDDDVAWHPAVGR